MAFVAFALALLGACASLGSPRATLTSTAIANFDQDEAAAPVENAAAIAVLTLDRRRFSLPSQRQPDLRMIFATAYDRKYRHMRRNMSGRAKLKRR